MASSRSAVVYLQVTRKEEDKTKEQKIAEKLNYASESTIIRTRFSRRGEKV